MTPPPTSRPRRCSTRRGAFAVAAGLLAALNTSRRRVVSPTAEPLPAAGRAS